MSLQLLRTMRLRPLRTMSLRPLRTISLRPLTNHEPPTVANHEPPTVANHEPPAVANHEPPTVANHIHYCNKAGTSAASHADMRHRLYSSQNNGRTTHRRSKHVLLIKFHVFTARHFVHPVTP
ncbi:hypothetical protein BV898_00568 [Hypsibius exemplaris]|uniref:Uncharacterized protein n=1 Tax=Hypsibius exemplaris TaxID=2072580 RepID=A0A1W0XDU8_HYPEX|nr:hypothetical protein BV898_00568 [Hypsibius exemplaris]